MCVCSSAGADVFVVEDVVGVWRCLVVGVGVIVDVCCCMLVADERGSWPYERRTLRTGLLRTEDATSNKCLTSSNNVCY